MLDQISGHPHSSVKFTLKINYYKDHILFIASEKVCHFDLHIKWPIIPRANNISLSKAFIREIQEDRSLKNGKEYLVCG